MKKIRRAIHIDFHTMPGIYNFNENYDAEKFAETLYNANVEYVNLFCKCNIGYAYYKTKIGIPYPNMKGDMFGDTLKACHKRGIGVSAYFNVGLDHLQSEKHRDWLVVNKDGTIEKQNKYDNFFRKMCYNSPYSDYILSLVKEVIDNYDVDGVFLDCFGVHACYGNECVEEMVKLGIDPTNEDDVLEYAKKSYESFCGKFKEIVGEDKNFYINGWDENPDFAPYNYNTDFEIEGLPGGLGYDCYPTIVAIARNIKKDVIYMTGRFQIAWGDFGGYKGKTSLQYDMWDAISNGVEMMIGDHMRPNANIEKNIYDDIRDVYSEAKFYEKWTESARYKCDVGVLMGNKIKNLYNTMYKGVTNLLGELNIPFDFILSNMDFDKYSVIIIPDTVRIDEKTAEKLNKYVQKGGKIFASGEGGLSEDGTKFLLDNDFSFSKIDKSQVSYYKDGESDFNWSTYESGILFKSNEKEVFARYVKPYFDIHWDGRQAYVYTPPDKTTEYSASASNGKIARIAFKLFQAYYDKAMPAHRDLFKKVFDTVYKEPIVKADELPKTSRITLTENKDYLLLHVKVTYPVKRGNFEVIEEHNYLPEGVKVAVKGKFKKAYSPIDKKEYTLKQDGKYSEITLPSIKGYLMIVLEK